MRTFLILFILITSCNPKSTPSFKVDYKGALKNMMHKGDLSAKISLSEINEINYLYALGAVEELKGEVLVINSNVFVSSVSTLDTIKSMFIDTTFNKNASLLVYASVEEWISINIPNTIITYEDFEVFVEEIALKKGINTDKPFPFMIEGIAKSFDWHIIDWPEDDTEHSHEKHIHSGLYGTLENQEAEMLGFYSNKHHAIFTHHTTNMHIHVKSEKVIGHIDDMTFGIDMMLKIPK
ncbi:MAG: decarboxylase [Flavobacteriales bacterium]|jgi:acetolactate decarboxylase|nr:decarboxylase [Flavobacteriales bacterium]MBT5354219.1 decarboxylase [Flavobacteriales bacterium]MBT6815906.1 decarboxylase [Flavobacteriales bacterium]MBT7619566.1 decarboxylase [Flavobacteriales bacterium]MBT7726972.1 decarboxylase [Flavobacteriales bacterium]